MVVDEMFSICCRDYAIILSISCPGKSHSVCILLTPIYPIGIRRGPLDWRWRWRSLE